MGTALRNSWTTVERWGRMSVRTRKPTDSAITCATKVDRAVPTT
ncbi:hypothetical protein [Kocuria rosea]|nr:hypothetical protein [Kocuria rosea]